MGEMTRSSIQFSKGGPKLEWLKSGEPQMVQGSSSISVRAEFPSPDAEVTDDTATVCFSALIAGDVRGGPAKLKLLHYKVAFEPTLLS